MDGPATVRQFLGAVDRCYARLRARLSHETPGLSDLGGGPSPRARLRHRPGGGSSLMAAAGHGIGGMQSLRQPGTGSAMHAAPEAVASGPASAPAAPQQQRTGSPGPASSSARTSSPASSPLSRCDYFVSHAPFNKIVRKALSRLHYQVSLSLSEGG